MNYNNIKDGIFISRPNRFVAEVLIDGELQKVHVKNTGRLKELLISGRRCILEEGNNPVRKTKYSLVSIEKPVYNGISMINIDSQMPNAVATEALIEGAIKEIGIPDCIKREVKYGSSRFDIAYTKNKNKGFIEVKGVTLDIDGTAMFPDAPTERGARHLKELINAKAEGYECAVLFVIQMKGISRFKPYTKNDKAFSDALKAAFDSGVKILAYDCIVTENSIRLDKNIPVEF